MHTYTRAAIVERLEQEQVVAVIRAPTADTALFVSRALVAAGVRLLEITCTVPNAVNVIATLIAELPPDVLVGAGTVLTTAQALEVLDAGARFVVAPVLALGLIPTCHDREAVCIPAGLTPSELATASIAGADMVKLFPAAAVGGPRYVADVLAPLPDLRIMASGGIDLDTMCMYLAAGCRCVGLGSALVPQQLVAARDTAALVAYARHCLTRLEA
jgi:2-dehydro-3-deoxyphosphogluconate aldolase/(4S)-4-hydroxy-2-oxoglutarate aldolase